MKNYSLYSRVKIPKKNTCKHIYDFPKSSIFRDRIQVKIIHMKLIRIEIQHDHYIRTLYDCPRETESKIMWRIIIRNHQSVL